MVVPLQLLAFLQGLFTFYHEGYELAHEFEPYKQQLQFNLQNVSVPTPVRGGRRWRRGVGVGGGGVACARSCTKGSRPHNYIQRLIAPRRSGPKFPQMESRTIR